MNIKSVLGATLRVKDRGLLIVWPALPGTRPPERVTREGMGVGTPRWAPPKKIQGGGAPEGASTDLSTSRPGTPRRASPKTNPASSPGTPRRASPKKTPRMGAPRRAPPSILFVIQRFLCMKTMTCLRLRRNPWHPANVLLKEDFFYWSQSIVLGSTDINNC